VALLRVVLVAAVAARPHGVRGTPAADVRRYVAMDATMTDVSTVMRSMPTPPSDARIQASMTIPLSKTRSRASRKLVRSAVRSTGIAHYPANGARSAPPTEGQPFSSALSMEQTISRMGLRGAPRRRSRCTGPRRQHGPLSSTRSRTSTMLLALCPALWYCGPALLSTDTHPLSNRQRGRNRDTVQRGCLIRYAQISAS